jgi:hypothetical protein
MKMPFTILLVVLFILPYINIVTLIITVYEWILYELNYSIYEKNKQRVPNLFRNMIYHPDV